MEQPSVEPVAEVQNTQNPAPTMGAVPEPENRASSSPPKPVHSLVIDANAIIKNDPTVSTLLAQAEELYTIPAVVSESTLATLPVLPSVR
jgi:RNA-binding protein NOB1